MKNIIFLTDFSKNSDSALDYFAAFSKDLPASNIFLIHTYALATKTGMLMSIKERMKDDAKSLLINRKRRFEKASGDKHFVFYKAIEGHLVDKVARLEKQLSATLIVSSMRGQNASKTNLIGRSSGSIISKTQVPILFIPPFHKYKKISKLTLALKTPKIKKKSTVEILDQLFDVKDTKLKILLADNPKGKFDIKDIHLKGMNHKVDGSDEKTIFDAIMKDQKKNGSDMVIGVRRKRGFFEKFLKSGSIKKKNFNIDVPLLVLRGVE